MTFAQFKHFSIFTGERFGRMQVLVALVEILRSFKIVANAKTPKDIKFDEHFPILLRPGENICVDFVKDGLYGQ